jgi:FkbM family methyltransferase
MIRKVLRLPLALIPRNVMLPVLSGCNRGFWWVSGSHIHGCWIGWYEPEVQAALSRLIKPGMTVWDLGANAGFYTLASARMVGPAGRVVAFEPSARNVHHLLTHLRINRRDNVVVHQSAVTDGGGFTSFAIHNGSEAMSHLAASPTGYLVGTVSIDGVLAEHPEWSPNLVKIDVEGAEERVLAGGQTLLGGPRPPTIVLSLHGLEEARQCLRILMEHGYAVTSLSDEHVASAEAALALDTVIARPTVVRGSAVSRAGQGVQSVYVGSPLKEIRE